MTGTVAGMRNWGWKSFAGVAVAAVSLTGACADGSTSEPDGVGVELEVVDERAVVRIVADSAVGRFEFDTVVVPAGTTVVWVNETAHPHNVVLDDGPASPLFFEGGTYELRFDAPGEFPYSCTLHPGMDGTVVVTAA